MGPMPSTVPSATRPGVPGHAPMAHGVVSVGGQSDFDDVVPLEAHHLGHVCPHRAS